MADHTASVAKLLRVSVPKQRTSSHVRSRESFVMTIFEAVSPTLNEPIHSMFCGSECVCLTEASALDRWTNEGGALDQARFVREVSVGQPTGWIGHRNMPIPRTSMIIISQSTYNRKSGFPQSSETKSEI